MVSRKMLTILLVALLSMTLPAMTAAETPKRGGILRVAMEAEPPSLDPHTTTATIVMVEAMHWLEAPFIQGGKYEVIPDLAESYEKSDVIYRTLKNQGEIKNRLIKYGNKAGEVRTGYISAELISLGNEPCAIILNTDVTRQKEIEASKSQD